MSAQVWSKQLASVFCPCVLLRETLMISFELKQVSNKYLLSYNNIDIFTGKPTHIVLLITIDVTFSHRDITTQMELYLKSNFKVQRVSNKYIIKGVSQVQLNN